MPIATTYKKALNIKCYDNDSIFSHTFMFILLGKFDFNNERNISKYLCVLLSVMCGKTFKMHHGKIFIVFIYYYGTGIRISSYMF